MTRRAVQSDVFGGRWVVRTVLALVVALGCSGLLVPPVTAAVPAREPLSITYVARQCGAYPDVMANKARNNIQESLRRASVGAS